MYYNNKYKCRTLHGGYYYIITKNKAKLLHMTG